MIRNFLKGEVGDAVNALLAASAFNLKKRYNQIRATLKGQARVIFDLLYHWLNRYLNQQPNPSLQI